MWIILSITEDSLIKDFKLDNTTSGLAFISWQKVFGIPPEMFSQLIKSSPSGIVHYIKLLTSIHLGGQLLVRKGPVYTYRLRLRLRQIYIVYIVMVRLTVRTQWVQYLLGFFHNSNQCFAQLAKLAQLVQLAQLA